MKHMMKLSLAIVLIVGLSHLSAAQGATKRVAPSAVGKTLMFGAGAIVGEPIGASLKYWWAPDSPFGIQGGIGYDLTEEALALWADGLYHFKNTFDITFPWADGKAHTYVGGGLKVSFPDGSGSYVALRIPVGLENTYSGQDWSIGGELVPAIRWGTGKKSGTSLVLDGGIYIRKYLF